MVPPDTFSRIYSAVSDIPYGHVASYGHVAQQAGLSRSAARVVGWALRALPNDQIPWWRVVNRHGILSIRNPHLGPAQQAARLQEEGVVVEENQGFLSVRDPQWHLP